MKQIHLPSIANTLGSVLAGRIGLNVRFSCSASTAMTNGKEVILPTFVEVGGENEAAILRGFLAHEILGHVRHTDFVFGRRWHKGKSALAQALLNIIEDARIERAAWQVYPGSRRILHECVAALRDRGGFFDLPSKPSEASVLTAFLLVSLRTKELEQPLNALPFAAQALKVFGKSLRDEILAIATDGARGASTEDVARAVEKILGLLHQLQEEAENAEDAKAAKAIQAVLNAKEAEIGDTDLGSTVSSLLGDHRGSSPATVVEMPRKAGWRPSHQAMATARKLGAKLELQLQTRTEEEDSLGRRGRLWSKRVARPRVLDFDVFLEEGDEAEGLNTALALLVDRSGSMGSMDCGGDVIYPMEMAIITAAAMGEAIAPFESQGVSIAMYAFNQKVFKMKAFESAWRTSRESLGFCDGDDGTWFQEALLAVAQDIAKRKERRKVIFAITDGDLGDEPSIPIETMRSLGIEVRVVFIGSREHMAVLANDAKLKVWGAAETPQEIPAAVFSSLDGVF